MTPAEEIRAWVEEGERLELEATTPVVWAKDACVREPRARRALVQVVNYMEADWIAGTPHVSGLAEQRLARVAAILRGEPADGR